MIRYAVVPEGKVLHVIVGDYYFVGPCKIDLREKFVIPPTYMDGTPVQLEDINDTQQSNNNAVPAPSTVSSQKTRSKSGGDSPAKLHGDDSVQSSAGPDDGLETVQRKRPSKKQVREEQWASEESGSETDSDTK